MTKTRFKDSSISDAKREYRKLLYSKAAGIGAKSFLVLTGPTPTDEINVIRSNVDGAYVVALDRTKSHVGLAEVWANLSVLGDLEWMADKTVAQRLLGQAQFDVVNADFCSNVMENIKAIEVASSLAKKLLAVTVSVGREQLLNEYLTASDITKMNYGDDSSLDEIAGTRLSVIDRIVKSARPDARLDGVTKYLSANNYPMVCAIFSFYCGPECISLSAQPKMATAMAYKKNKNLPSHDADVEAHRAVCSVPWPHPGKRCMKRFCKRGHDKLEVGTRSDGKGCAACRVVWDHNYRTRQKEKAVNTAARIEKKRAAAQKRVEEKIAKIKTDAERCADNL